MQETICEIKLDDIRVSPFQPRRTFSEEELEELASSIRSVGLIHPPVVRKIEGGGKVLYYELIAGERRWRACKKAGLEKINVIVRNSSDEHAAKATLIENVQRVNLDPIEMAEAFKKLIEIFRMTQEELAEKVGKKRSTVANYLRLLSLPKEIRNQLTSGSITMGHAKAILSLDTLEHQNQLSELILSRQLTVREAEKASKKIVKKKKSNQQAVKKDVHIDSLRETLEQKLGTKARIETSKGGGKVVLNFYGMEDLERLLSAMGIEVDLL